MTNAPDHAFLAKLYLDQIGLRSEVDIFDLGARDQCRARKRVEARIAQVETSALFDSMNKFL